MLGKSIGLSFTERMEFTPTERIVYTHAPQGDERAGVEGVYVLTDSGDATRLSIELGVHVDLPFPKLAKPAVRASMQAVIAAMGVGFARNLERQLKSRRA